MSIRKLTEAIQTSEALKEIAEHRGRKMVHPSRSWKDKDNPTGDKVIQKILDPSGFQTYLKTHAAKLKDKQERELFITKLIISGRWRSGYSMMLADVWGLTPRMVYDMVEIGSKFARLSLGDRDQLRQTALSFLELVAHDAYEAGDRRSAIAAVRTFAEISGIAAPKKHEITGAGGGAIEINHNVRQMTDEELDAEIVAMAEEVKKLPAKKSPVFDAEFSEIVETVLTDTKK